MRRVAVVVLAMLVIAPAPVTARGIGRTKPGPVTIRGVVENLRSAGFTLRTTSTGNYTIELRSATAINVVHGTTPARLRAGDHVGVRGFLHGRTIVAIHVTIYPTKPHPVTTSLQGTIAAVTLPEITVVSGGKRVAITVTSSTDIHIGSASGTPRQLHAGAKVLVRAQVAGHSLLALSIHVYSTRTTGTHVVLHGTVVAVSKGSITVTSGSQRSTASLTTSTAVHVSGGTGSLSSLHAGQTVTVYACCQNAPLVATSIHIDKTPPAASGATTIRGTVTSIGSGSLRLKETSGSTTVAIARGTVVQLGSSTITAKGILVGDEVSVRGTAHGGEVIASRIHIYVSSRTVHRVEGTVVAISRGTLTVRSSTGTRYTVSIARNTAITRSAKTVTAGSLRVGDTVRAYGRYTSPTTLAAERIQASAAATAVVRTVRGVVASVGGGVLVVVTSTGARYRVQLARGVKILLNGKPAPQIAMFPGARVDAKGTISGSNLAAASVTLSVTTRSVTGRITATRHAKLDVRETRGTVIHVDVVAGTAIRDGTRRLGIAAVHVGGYVKAAGYVAGTDIVRATTVTIEHPVVSVIGSLTVAPNGFSVRASDGQVYVIRLEASTQIVSERTHLPLQPADVLSGAYVHVTGTIDTSGALKVQVMSVRLASVTIRGKVQTLGAGVLTVVAGTVSDAITLLPTAAIMQGSHSLALTDIVAGDDVTVYGYAIANGILARQVTVHRTRITLSGTIGQITATGFMLVVGTTTYTVVVASFSVFSGVVPQAGSAVHMSGYRRGDGSILAATVQVSGP